MKVTVRGASPLVGIPMKSARGSGGGPSGTGFQRAVWQATARIPYGATATYGQIAALINRDRSARAVGQALGQNPLPIIIPCHRVVGSAGRLGGFGGGIEMKRLLLRLENGVGVA